MYSVHTLRVHSVIIYLESMQVCALVHVFCCEK